MSAMTTILSFPVDYVPGEHDVVIGKGKKFYFHAGNQWLRTVVSSRIEEYSAAVTKSDKSDIISSVIDYISANGRFIKLDTNGSWVFAEPVLCREKCSQTFRDNLAETYRSSNVAKRNKRRAEQREKITIDPSMEPQAKRMRSSSVPTADMYLLSVPSSPNTCASWFDWDMPLEACDLEPIAVDSAPSSDFASDLDHLLIDLTSNNFIVDECDIEPRPIFEGDFMPVKNYSSSFVTDASAHFRVGQNFQHRSRAAFAA